MPTPNYRDWTWIREDGPLPDTFDRISVRADALMREWSELHHQDEQEGFQRMSYRDGDEEDPMYGGIEDPGRRSDYDSDEEYEEAGRAYEAEIDRRRHERRVRDEQLRIRMEYVENELAALGVRPMRAYEHHAEDEEYVRYMEEGRFGHCSY